MMRSERGLGRQGGRISCDGCVPSASATAALCGGWPSSGVAAAARWASIRMWPKECAFSSSMQHIIRAICIDIPHRDATRSQQQCPESYLVVPSMLVRLVSCPLIGSGARANEWGSSERVGLGQPIRSQRERVGLKRAGGARANGWGSNKTFFANQAPDCIHPPYSYSVERPSSTWSSSLGRPHVHASQRARPLLLTP
jgi:hypothetical protein